MSQSILICLWYFMHYHFTKFYIVQSSSLNAKCITCFWVHFLCCLLRLAVSRTNPQVLDIGVTPQDWLAEPNWDNSNDDSLICISPFGDDVFTHWPQHQSQTRTCRGEGVFDKRRRECKGVPRSAWPLQFLLHSLSGQLELALLPRTPKH